MAGTDTFTKMIRFQSNITWDRFVERLEAVNYNVLFPKATITRYGHYQYFGRPTFYMDFWEKKESKHHFMYFCVDAPRESEMSLNMSYLYEKPRDEFFSESYFEKMSDLLKSQMRKRNNDEDPQYQEMGKKRMMED